MTKVKLFFLAALAVVLLAGCSFDDNGPEDQQLYNVGDYYPDPEAVYRDGVLQSGTAAIGIVYWLRSPSKYSRYGSSGRIVSLDEAPDYLRWGSSGETGATYSGYGLANMVAVKSIDNTFSTYPVFAWVDQKNGAAGTTAYVPGATGIWYLPAVGELQQLLCFAAFRSGEEWGFLTIDDNKVWYPSFNPTWDSEIDLLRLNARLTSAGGTALDASTYWSSSGNYVNSAWGVSFSSGYTYVYNKTSEFKARCIMMFSSD